MAVVVTGYNELSQLGFRLREARAVTLTKELREGLRRPLKPLADQIRAGAPDHTPKGYEMTFARSLKFQTKVSLVGTGAGVDFSVTATGKSYSRQIREINRGRLKHPVYGRRRYTRKGWINNPWVWQAVEPGFFDNPVRANFNAMRESMREAMRRTAEQITKG
jgi:hypothetical protein